MRQRIILWVGIFVVLLVACSSSSEPEPGPEPFDGAVEWEGLTGTIAFSHGYGRIAVLRAATREAFVLRVPDKAGIWEGSVALSPDGTRIAYAAYSYLYPGYRVFVMRTDGSDRHQLPCGSTPCISPTWMPDGSGVAYVTGWGGAGTVVVAPPDGSTSETLAFTSFGKVGISRDGQRFATNEGTPFNDPPVPKSMVLAILHRDGTELARISGTPGVVSPSWSPDGTKIAFVRTYTPNTRPGACEVDIEVADVASSEVKTVVHQPYDCAHYFADAPEVQVSPDGTHLLFNAWTESDRGSELYIAGLDGSGMHRVTQGGALGVSWVE